MIFLIAHAPHAPGRQVSLARLREHLPGPGGEVVRSRGPEHASQWSRRLWERAAEFEDHVCLLNDDVILEPDFIDRIERAISAVPDECISLHASNPNVATVPGAWARAYHYSGPGVILPPGAAARLLKFVYKLPWSLLSRMNEDAIANAWAWSEQRPFWYLLPSPLTHDTSVPSTLGYDAHPHRVPVLLGPERPLEVPDRDVVPFVELPWGLTAALNYRHQVLRAGRSLCSLCVGREAEIGNRDVALCMVCLDQLNKVVPR